MTNRNDRDFFPDRFRVPEPDTALRTRTLTAARSALSSPEAPRGWRLLVASLRARPVTSALAGGLVVAHILLFVIPRPAPPDRSTVVQAIGDRARVAAMVAGETRLPRISARAMIVTEVPIPGGY